ncbi:MAG TPA: cation-transporting P-type ATPase [Candidatus Lokiarchaeia archaeon]|nr:cation-transporting P-type ATPase [Candidatus Lokiarchaeia archaeon]
MENSLPPYAMSTGEILEQFGISEENGLANDQVLKFRAQYGENTLPEKKKSVWKVYFKPLFNLMTLILLVAAVINLILYAAFEQSTLTTAVLIFGVVLLNFFMSIFQTFRAQKALAALKKLTGFKTTVIRGGQKKRIESLDLVVGDLLSLEMGDYIGADARIVSATEFKVDESTLTGESMPVKKHGELLPNDSPLAIQEQENMVFMGTFAVAGEAKAIVVSTGLDTQIGKIAQTLEMPEDKEVPLQQKMNALAKGIGIMVIILIGVMLVISFAVLSVKGTLDTEKVAQFVALAAALSVAAIPVNFPIMTTIILLAGVISLARSKLIVRKLAAIESLGRISVICTDKTGTLTKNEMTIQHIWTSEGTFDITGLGYAPGGQFFANNGPVDAKKNPLLDVLLIAGVASNTAEISTEKVKIHKQVAPVVLHKIIGEPTEGAFLVLAMKAGYDIKKVRLEYPVEKCFPFSSERKRNTVISTHKGIIQVFTKGAVEVVTNLCSQIWINQESVPLSDEYRAKIESATFAMASKGMRTLAVAMKTVKGIVTDIPEEDAECDLIFLGVVCIIDPPREGVRDAIISCQNAGIKVVMITGDHPNTAAAIASNLGFYNPAEDKILTGPEIPTATPSEITQTAVFARVGPNDKQLIVTRFKEGGRIVAMTGDGVNDALALQKADAGVAMGISGTDVAKNAADLILGDDSFATIEEGVFQGRGIFKNVRSCILYLLTGNIAEMLLIFFTSIVFQAAFFQPLQLIYFYVTVHFFPVLALMFDKMNRKELMTQPPKDPREGITNTKILLMLGIQVGLVAGMAALAFIIGYFYVLPGNTPQFSSYPLDINNALINLQSWHGRTLALLTVVISESIIAFNVRSEKSIRHSGWNLWVIVFVTFTIATAGIVTSVDIGQSFLTVTPLTVVDWLIAAALSSPVIILVEVYKKYPPNRLIKWLQSKFGS